MYGSFEGTQSSFASIHEFTEKFTEYPEYRYKNLLRIALVSRVIDVEIY